MIYIVSLYNKIKKIIIYFIFYDEFLKLYDISRYDYIGKCACWESHSICLDLIDNSIISKIFYVGSSIPEYGNKYIIDFFIIKLRLVSIVNWVNKFQAGYKGEFYFYHITLNNNATKLYIFWVEIDKVNIKRIPKLYCIINLGITNVENLFVFYEEIEKRFWRYDENNFTEASMTNMKYWKYVSFYKKIYYRLKRIIHFLAFVGV